MSPVTHFFTGWVLANSASFSRKERARAPVAPLFQVDGAVSLWRYPGTKLRMRRPVYEAPPGGCADDPNLQRYRSCGAFVSDVKIVA
jgi:hypothetical protein